jgi:hypothetical protein
MTHEASLVQSPSGSISAHMTSSRPDDMHYAPEGTRVFGEGVLAHLLGQRPGP